MGSRMSSVKHILFLSHYFPPEVNVPASRTFEHAKRWVKKGLKVTVLTNNPNHPHGKLYPGYKNKIFSKEVIDNIVVYRVKTFLTKNTGFWMRLVNYITYFVMAIITSSRVKNLDVIIATSPQFFCGLAGVFISKIKGKPFILEVRDLWPGQIEALGFVKNTKILNALYRLERFMYSSADKIITVTDFQNHHIVNLGYPREDISTIYNAVDLEFFASHRSNQSEKDTFVASYIGFFGTRYALDVIVDTAIELRDCPDIEFRLIGEGKKRESIAKKLLEFDLDNLKLIPLQPKSEIPKIIAESDVGLIIWTKDPVFEITIPAKMFEYWALKKPVILASFDGDGTKIINQYNAGIVIKPEDKDELKEAILKLYSDKDLQKTLGENGYQAVLELYNRDNMSERMLNVIRSISI